MTVIIRERGYNRRSWSHRARTQDIYVAIDRAVRRNFGASARFEQDSTFQSSHCGTLYTGRVVRRVGLGEYEVLHHINIRVDAA